MTREDGRHATQLRPIRIRRGFTRNPTGSVLIQAGKTMILCTACWEKGVPEWRKGSGSGWVTAEYDMLPASTSQRRKRNRTAVDGRTQEIQRLIGRSLRSIIDFGALGENSILIDCDVLQADGGTRTAAITGAYIALRDTVRHALANKLLARSPITDTVAATSVGRVKGRLLLDLDYAEDSAAEVDLNVVMTGDMRFVEIQGTAERVAFSRNELDKMLALATRGIKELFKAQARALRTRARL